MVVISTLIAQGASPVYTFCKDIFLYIKGQKRDIEALEERLSELINHLMSIKSEKKKIDRLLSHSPSMEQSEAYAPTESEIAAIDKKWIKFVGKYMKITNNRLSSTTELDASTASFMIAELGDFKSEIVTPNALKLAKLSRDITKLSKRAWECIDRLKPEKMTQKRSKPVLDKLDGDGHVLPVFDTYVDKVLHYLFVEEGNKIGIFGCQGAGKTTVLRKLYDRLLELKSLDNIIRVEFPPEMETPIDADKIVERLQKEIMAQLNIDHDAATSTIKNENTISAFLSQKKYMLLIDHVSTYIDLEKLGLREAHKHMKVVVCSREMKVLRRMTGHEVPIQRLERDEALMLFQNIRGKLSDGDRKKAIAERIIECCAGIPWIIRGVAIYLKDKKDEKSWNYVKTILQSKSKSLELLDLGGFDKVYEMRYERLETDAKKCLLYGALFPHQHKIYTDYLVECWIAEGFIVDDADQKVRVNRERGQTILNKLTDDDLLQWYSEKKLIMMPTNIRRVALELEYPNKEECRVWIPSEDRKQPKDSTWTTVSRMSLIGCKLELPQSPQSCKLYTLLLDSLKHESRLIPDSFFKHMVSLQVLALKLTKIGALPKSIKELVNLKSLYLNDCLNLKALPSEAAELVKLEFLDITGTSIPSLPPQIRCMVNMRCLRASLSSQDVEKIIPPGIISNLRNLEELSLVTAFDFGVDVAERLAKELASLEYLNTLCFSFPNVSSLNTFVTHSKALKNTETSWSSHTFRSFKISIGCHETQLPYESDIESGHERWFRFSTSEKFSPACQELLNQASAFEVIGHGNLTSFTCGPFNLNPVKVCVVESCKDLENIMDGYLMDERQGFFKESLLQNLEKLHLYNLNSLRCIWSGPVPPTALANLTAITINGCPKLTKILDRELALSLQSLEYLKVENCCQISKIIEESGETAEIVQESRTNSDLPITSLKKMELSNLPELKSICESETSSISWTSLKTIIVIKCSELRNLSLTLTNATDLASIQCEESWWDTIPFPDVLRQRLLPLCSFKDAGGEASSSGTSESTADENNTSINPTTEDEHEELLTQNLQTFVHETTAAKHALAG